MSDPLLTTHRLSGLPELPGNAPPQQTSAVLLAHRALRGRYFWAILLGIIFAIPAGYLGYTSTQPAYRAVGMVRVAPTVPFVISPLDEQHRVPPLFDSYVATQAAFIKHRRVLDAAVFKPDLRSVGWPQGMTGVAALEKAVQVGNTRGSELIQVSVLDPDPARAVKALNSVLSAFDELKDELAGNDPTAIERSVASLLEARNRDLIRKRGEIFEMSRTPAGNVQDLHQMRLDQIAEYDRALSEINRQIAELTARRVETPAEGGEVDATREMLAMRDPLLANYLQRIEALDTEIEVKQSYLGPRHNDILQLKNDRDATERLAQNRERLLRENPQLDPTTAGRQAGMTIAQLQHLKNSYTTMGLELRKEADELSQKLVEINRLRAQEEELQREVADAQSRLTALRTERQNAITGRVTVYTGEQPTGPAQDRRKIYALAAAVAGGGFGVGLIALFGFIRNGYRYIDELDTPEISTPLLGTIPDLRSSDPLHDELAALSVHHLRNMLQQSGDAAGSRAVHAVTSGAAGDGKTSLALALGMSFAVSGHRTLLVDADLVGSRLSRLLGLAKSEGLTNALRSDTLNGEVHTTRVPNLWAIPTGNLRDFTPERLSAGEIGRLLQTLRGRFDQIIIDTGPVLGSLEAGLVCPLADRVVLIVSAGQNPRAVQASLQRLRQLGATCAGIVFNRARRDDFDRSVSTGAMSRSTRSVAASQRPPEDDGGSLIRALTAEQQSTVAEPKEAR